MKFYRAAFVNELEILKNSVCNNSYDPIIHTDLTVLSRVTVESLIPIKEKSYSQCWVLVEENLKTEEKSKFQNMHKIWGIYTMRTIQK